MELARCSVCEHRVKAAIPQRPWQGVWPCITRFQRGHSGNRRCTSTRGSTRRRQRAARRRPCVRQSDRLEGVHSVLIDAGSTPSTMPSVRPRGMMTNGSSAPCAPIDNGLRDLRLTYNMFHTPNRFGMRAIGKTTTRSIGTGTSKTNRASVKTVMPQAGKPLAPQSRPCRRADTDGSCGSLLLTSDRRARGSDRERLR